MLLHSVQKSKQCIQNVGRGELHRGMGFVSVCISARFSKACQWSSMNIEGEKRREHVFSQKLSFVFFLLSADFPLYNLLAFFQIIIAE